MDAHNILQWGNILGKYALSLYSVNVHIILWLFYIHETPICFSISQKLSQTPMMYFKFSISQKLLKRGVKFMELVI